MISFRLKKEEEMRLTQICQQRHLTKTTVIRKALQLFFEQEETENHPYALGHELFDSYGSGETDRSLTYKQRIKEQVREKHTH